MINYLLVIKLCSGTLQENGPVVPLNIHTVLTIVANCTGIVIVPCTPLANRVCPVIAVENG